MAIGYRFPLFKQGTYKVPSLDSNKDSTWSIVASTVSTEALASRE